MLYTLLADAVIALHLGYVAFVVLGQLLILLGWAFAWRWTRNLRFRIIHLVMLEVVALEGLFGIICPMTHWEDHLRTWARGETFTPYQETTHYGLLDVPGKLIDRWYGLSTPPTRVPAPTMPTGPQEPSPAPAVSEIVPEKGAPVALPPAEPPPNPQRAEAPPPPVAHVPVEAKIAEPPADSTFVGRILDSILFVNVDQKVLDWWYVGFGVVSIAVFFAYPPDRGRWTWLGLSGLILTWVGAVFLVFIWLVFGLSLLMAGLCCRWISNKLEKSVSMAQAS